MFVHLFTATRAEEIASGETAGWIRSPLSETIMNPLWALSIVTVAGRLSRTLGDRAHTLTGWPDPIVEEEKRP